MGLGLTGIANAIELMCGKANYGEQDFCNILDRICATLTYWAYDTSAELAKTRGTFNLYDKEVWYKTN